MNVFGYIKNSIKELKTKKIEIKEAIELFKILYDEYDNVFLFESLEKDILRLRKTTILYSNYTTFFNNFNTLLKS